MEIQVEKEVSYDNPEFFDTGTGKSQILLYMERLSEKSVYTTGPGCTAAGLTASVRKNKDGFCIDRGPLILCDQVDFFCKS